MVITANLKKKITIIIDFFLLFFYDVIDSGFIVGLAAVGSQESSGKLFALKMLCVIIMACFISSFCNNFLYYYLVIAITIGDLAVGIIVLIIACGFGLVAFGDFLLLVRVRILLLLLLRFRSTL